MSLHHNWHEYGVCLSAEKHPAARFRADAKTQKTKSQDCSKEVAQRPGGFDLTITWRDGSQISLSADWPQGHHTMEVSVNNKPAVILAEEVMGFSECYAYPDDNHLKFICFKGNGVVFSGPAAPPDAVKPWQLAPR